MKRRGILYSETAMEVFGGICYAVKKGGGDRLGEGPFCCGYF